MNVFVHGRLRHFLQEEMDEDGGNGDGGEQQKESEEEEHEEEEALLLIDGKASEEDEEHEQEEEGGKPAPSWVKKVREENREKSRKIRELEERLQKQESPQQKSEVVLGKKPAMEDDDIDWDAEKFEAALESWHERKRQIDDQQRQVEVTQKQQQEAWQKQLDSYAAAKGALKFKDFDDAEENTRAALDVTQQGIIIQGADNSALVIYALGKNPKRAAELAAIKDPIKFAFAIARLEGKLGTQSKKPTTTPEKTVTGNGRIASNSSDSTLDRLREEAAKTGDMSKVLAYKRDQKRKARG